MPELSISEGFSLIEEISTETSGAPTIQGVSIFTFEIGFANPQISWSRSYEAWPVQRDAIRISSTEQIDSLQLTLANISWLQSLKMLRSDDVHGKIVRIWQGFLDIDKEEANLSPLFEGEIDRVNYDERIITIALKGNIKYLEKDGLRRTFSIFCPFQFKGRQCGYVGPDSTCDKSYTDCNSRGNSKNFGGFDTLLKIQGTREII